MASFRSQQTFPTGSLPNSLALADLNGDGMLDIIVANVGNQTAGVLLGNGNGIFPISTNLPYWVLAKFVGVGRFEWRRHARHHSCQCRKSNGRCAARQRQWHLSDRNKPSLLGPCQIRWRWPI